jgi:hypothetical protein
MASIMIVADNADGGDAAVFLAERVSTVQLGNLVERLKLAGEDAERAAAVREPQTAPPRREP